MRGGAKFPVTGGGGGGGGRINPLKAGDAGERDHDYRMGARKKAAARSPKTQELDEIERAKVRALRLGPVDEEYPEAQPLGYSSNNAEAVYRKAGLPWPPPVPGDGASSEQWFATAKENIFGDTPSGAFTKEEKLLLYLHHTAFYELALAKVGLRVRQAVADQISGEVENFYQTMALPWPPQYADRDKESSKLWTIVLAHQGSNTYEFLLLLNATLSELATEKNRLKNGITRHTQSEDERRAIAALQAAIDTEKLTNYIHSLPIDAGATPPPVDKVRGGLDMIQGGYSSDGLRILKAQYLVLGLPWPPPDPEDAESSEQWVASAIDGGLDERAREIILALSYNALVWLEEQV